MLIQRLKVAGLLSFGREGIDLSLKHLNVLIGPNGSGKSNLLESIALLQVAPNGLTYPGSHAWSGVGNWLWQGSGAPQFIAMEVVVDDPSGAPLRHSLTLAERNGGPQVTCERVEPWYPLPDERLALSYYRPPRDESIASEVAESHAEASRAHSGKRIPATENGRHHAWSPAMVRAPSKSRAKCGPRSRCSHG